MKKDYDSMAKMAIIGDSSVGKTNLLLRYVSASYNQSHIATIGIDFKVKTVQVNDYKIKLQIWDTAGQQRFRNLTGTIYQGAQAVLLTYAINNRRSFDNVSRWLEDVKSFASQNVIVAIAATKCDLQAQRAVDIQEGKALANKINGDFYQTSAKNGVNVQEVFKSIAVKLCKKHADKATNKGKKQDKKDIHGSTQRQWQGDVQKMEVKTAGKKSKGDSNKIQLNKEEIKQPKRKKCC